MLVCSPTEQFAEHVNAPVHCRCCGIPFVLGNGVVFKGQFKAAKSGAVIPWHMIADAMFDGQVVLCSPTCAFLIAPWEGRA